MTGKPDDASVSAWIALSRAQRVAFRSVEERLKSAGLPPLAWYDALWELEKAGEQGLRPFELERALLFEQYNLSRLADRLAGAGLVERKPCRDDARGHVLTITSAGRELRRRMWTVYSEAIEEAVGRRLGTAEAETLAALLRKLEQP
ncbi:MAG: winged helix-turn-helix transcriptional regulator [Rhizobiaceae bacterium]|nr:winged helix-turn-helix transcriptional regulator [Rhizobiaceae bacterium]